MHVHLCLGHCHPHPPPHMCPSHTRCRACQALVGTFNSTYAATRGIAFEFKSSSWHPDRVGPQFDRAFVIHAVGDGIFTWMGSTLDVSMKVQTQEVTVNLVIPEGIKPGKRYVASDAPGMDYGDAREGRALSLSRT